MRASSFFFLTFSGGLKSGLKFEICSFAGGTTFRTPLRPSSCVGVR